jgi:hypothetical protein
LVKFLSLKIPYENTVHQDPIVSKLKPGVINYIYVPREKDTNLNRLAMKNI